MKHIKLPIYLDKAIELGLASLDDNTFRHPHTGEVNVQAERVDVIFIYQISQISICDVMF